MYGDYDNYYEPTLADEIFDEAKEKLEEALKAEIEERIQRAENILKEHGRISSELNRKKRKLESQERELERKFNELENDFKKEKLDKFIKDLQGYLGQDYYKLKQTSTRNPKCSSCNNERKYEVKMPDGTMKKIDCSCNKVIYSYAVEELPIFSMTIRKENKEVVIYLKYVDWDERLEIIPPKEIYNKFEDIANKDDSYGVFYTNKEEAQKHVDYLNELKG